MITECPHCHSKFNVNDACNGQSVTCSSCQQQFVIAPLAPRPIVPPPDAEAPRPKTNSLAIAAAICGVCCGFVGTILGIIAICQISSSHGTQKGMGWAIFGIIGPALLIIPMLVASVALPALVKARHHPPSHYENISCVNNLKQLAVAYQIYTIDNDKHLPPADQFEQLLSEYLANSKCLTCPSNTSPSPSYVYLGDSDMKLDSIAMPSEYPIIAETAPRHKIGTQISRNVVFADGHVTSMSEADFLLMFSILDPKIQERIGH